MPYLAVAIAGLAAGTVLVLMERMTGRRSYRRIASQAHCREIRDWLTHAVASLAHMPPGGMQATLTSGGIALALTRSWDAGVEMLDVSLSEARGHTRAAVAARIGALILHLLDRNQAEAALYRTRSGVRHLVLTKAPSPWVVRQALEEIWHQAAPPRLEFRRCDGV